MRLIAVTLKPFQTVDQYREEGHDKRYTGYLARLIVGGYHLEDTSCGVVHHMDDHAGDEASCAPIEPAGDDAEYRRAQ